MGVNPFDSLPGADLDPILARTEDLWPSLQGGRIFVTGPTGFFGSWLVESFHHAQRRLGFKGTLVLLCRDPRGWAERHPHLAASPSIQVHGGSLEAFRPPEGAFHGLIHLAVATEAPLVQYRHMVDGANRVLDFAAASGAARLLFTSSGAVYGPPPEGSGPLPEDCPFAPATGDPGTAYGQAKRATEFLFSAFAREQGVQAILARCFAFVGPGLKLDANFAIGNFIRDALRGEPIRILQDGTPLRSYLYAADLATWLWTLYFRGPSCRPVHVGSDQPISIADLARRVADLLHPGLGVTVGRRPEEGRAPSCYVPAIDRARTELGLEPWTGLDEAILRTAAWHTHSRRGTP
ncbi:NAD-dependent epimerase/dehydratase family protein [Mesoterricola silvestris]|uniref:dTDP-glucose 4,6-dehydratase n=1 Tax=Mesoterricola silvestris TaxID=2927979 RepID=A0AA48GKC4_9BACT|nr:NAD(P)-dependent oxidoreductase [Mesoterricola silvestris]BDU71020.1 dTDP-glucose 4,6-dehydratase [Mesoterricola silvestris]